MPKTISEWAVDVHANAVEHGWYEGQFIPMSASEKLAKHMLMVSEIAEATESVRKAEPTIWFCESGKPEGEAVELADCLIRLLDYCEFVGIDIEKAVELKHDYNKSRPYRHGGKSA